MLTLWFLPLVTAVLGGGEEQDSQLQPAPAITGWRGEIGDGFLKESRSVEVKVGRAFGTTSNGSNSAHDFWLAQLQGGLMLTDVMKPERWFGGNFEGTLQLMSGGQENPDGAYFVGLNAGLRYHFRTGTPVVPFLTGSFGLAITDAGLPDATGKFQFNEQIGGGARYFLSKQHAIGIEYTLWHVSNGGLREPNDGINGHIISIGFSWLF